MQDVYEDIDDSIFYMWQIWAELQSRMYQGLAYIIDKTLLLLFIINGFATAILTLVMIWWVSSFERKRKDVSDLYGIILQLPECILKAEIITKIKV